MDECPSCGRSAKLGWHKATMSPFAPMPCGQCETELAVSWKSYLLAISPGSIAFILAYFLLPEESVEQYIGFGFSVLMVILGQLYLMPLKLLDEDSEPEKS